MTIKKDNLWLTLIHLQINKNNATEIELVDYAEVYNDLFNSIYKKNDRQQILKKIIKGKDFYALEFYIVLFGKLRTLLQFIEILNFKEKNV